MPKTRIRKHGPRCVAAVLLAGVAIAGCGGSSATTLDTAKLERSIAGSILTQRHIYTLVSCPRSIPQQQGQHFTCTAKLTVGSYPINVTEVDGKGHVQYSNTAPLTALDTAKIERAITASVLSQRNVHARVSCPSNVLQKKGLQFTCTARASGKSYPFGVTETDGNGHVHYIGR